MNIWEGHRLILIYHCQFQIIFHSPVSFCGSNSRIGVITIASNVGICALDVVVSDNKVTITGKMILRWSWVINIVLFCKLYVIHLLKMLYSSNLSLCESSGKKYWVHSVALVTLPIPQPSCMIYWWKNNHSSSGPSLWGIFHIFMSGRYCMVRAVGGNPDSLWNVNGTLCDI